MMSIRFISGFVFGAGSGIAAFKFYTFEEQKNVKENADLSSIQRLIGRFGFPQSGADTRFYHNHVLSYDQARRTPRWVAEHLSAQRLLGEVDRKHCRFKSDPDVPDRFSAQNEDYFRSGWSRGHMAPAGDNKSSIEAMAETFYLSNIVPQNYENNAGFWNRLEMYCRELTERFSDVWVVSGPLMMPAPTDDGRKIVSYQVIGKHDVAVPTHLYKLILVQKDPGSLALGAFIIPNAPLGFDHTLAEFQVTISELERLTGLHFFPELDRPEQIPSLCEHDSCDLMDFRRFTLYISGRKIKSAMNLQKLEKILKELEEKGITPDEYLREAYQRKRREILEREEQQMKNDGAER
ncbi:hypothetical protein DNTS_009041 [Danionella cerebrum]|uniref:Nuclease EXOG, mitochondrial n=1 Tax=Danionella cerebrum TaxID=2873325 RepID=A0A553MQ84_9TELE|nr:hypothetical protein DNTS_009041 [Danionella translucida]